MEAPPKFPAGPFTFDSLVEWEGEHRQRSIDGLAGVPIQLEQALQGLDESALELKYNQWTIRQIVHHLADSHLNGYVRTRWALTEASPLIKTYNESKWSELADAKSMPIAASLKILEGVHSRWSGLIAELSQQDMSRTYFHTELVREVRLIESIANYIWHASHHISQIHWVRRHRLNGANTE